MAVGALAAGAIALSALALERGNPDVEIDTPSPAPTFALGVQPAPTASSEPAPAAPAAGFTHPGPEERFLSVGAQAMWRATAGECGVTPPLVERSDDGGETWVDVTPLYRGIGQVRSLEAFAGTEAEMIADMGDECETQYLRTFTQGRFWESYPELLEGATYLSATAPGVVITADGEIDAPCAAPWSLRSAGATLALICDGTTYRLAREEWERTVDDAAALTLDNGDVLVAHSDATCDGLAVTRFADDVSSAGCLDGWESGATAAVAVAPAPEILAWWGARVSVVVD